MAHRQLAARSEELKASLYYDWERGNYIVELDTGETGSFAGLYEPSFGFDVDDLETGYELAEQLILTRDRGGDAGFQSMREGFETPTSRQNKSDSTGEK